MVSGRQFRESLHKPMPGAPSYAINCRIVPAFTIESLQRNTCVLPPPKSFPFKECLPKSTQFKSCYLRGELPVSISSDKTSVTWKVEFSKLDYNHYLPIFFVGLAEIEMPYKFLALQGIHDMLDNGGPKIFPCIPQLIIPMKTGLNTKNKYVMIATLRCLQHLVKSTEMVGEALVPYYRQLLPTLNLFKEINVNSGDGIDYTQMKGENLADVINETLETLEEYGGEDAFINIKYMIPTYESCMLN